MSVTFLYTRKAHLASLVLLLPPKKLEKGPINTMMKRKLVYILMREPPWVFISSLAPKKLKQQHRSSGARIY